MALARSRRLGVGMGGVGFGEAPGELRARLLSHPTRSLSPRNVAGGS